MEKSQNTNTSGWIASKYISTRGNAASCSFANILLTGTAEDGGLYLPENLVPYSKQAIAEMAILPYPELCAKILQTFAGGSIPDNDIISSVQSGLSKFDHTAFAPLRQLDHSRWLMELFHGPTLAFKDYALQIVVDLIDRELGKKGEGKATVLCATSGDTGSAAIHASAGRKNINIVVLHPHNKVSPLQRRQMTTTKAGNVLNLAVKGDFDDCQTYVKALLADDSDNSDSRFIAVNSINWARIAAQVAYYAWAALRLGQPSKPVNFAIPTGNFGNAFAAYIAKVLGFPIGRSIVSSNKNDVLPRLFENGIMEKHSAFATIAPSMDIQIPSNFERYLFVMTNGDAKRVAAYQERLRTTGKYTLSANDRQSMLENFAAVCCPEDDIIREIQLVFKETGELLCPHTATASFALRNATMDIASTADPMVILATAHPGKFPQVTQLALGESLGGNPLPALARLQELEEEFVVVENNLQSVISEILAFTKSR